MPIIRTTSFSLRRPQKRRQRTQAQENDSFLIDMGHPGFEVARLQELSHRAIRNSILNQQLPLPKSAIWVNCISGSTSPIPGWARLGCKCGDLPAGGLRFVLLNGWGVLEPALSASLQNSKAQTVSPDRGPVDQQRPVMRTTPGGMPCQQQIGAWAAARRHQHLILAVAQVAPHDRPLRRRSKSFSPRCRQNTGTVHRRKETRPDARPGIARLSGSVLTGITFIPCRCRVYRHSAKPLLAPRSATPIGPFHRR